MFIVHVTPIQKRGVSRLSYFSASPIPVGSIVMVPVRKRAVRALVLACDDARNLKSMLRTNLYELKKLPQQELTLPFLNSFVVAIEKTAHYFVTPVGSLIDLYAPQVLFDIEDYPKPPTIEKSDSTITNERCALVCTRDKRLDAYTRLIRETFAKKRSVWIIAATTREVRRIGDMKIRGMEKYTFVLESSQTPKQQRDTLHKVLAETHPIILITTPGFLSIPRGDIGMYIIENEPSSIFVSQRQPYADTRILIENLAQEQGVPIVYAGTTLSTRIHKQRLDGFVRDMGENEHTLRLENKVHIVNTKEERADAKEQKRPFPYVSDTVCKALLDTVHAQKNSFVFAPRRGLATYTVCNDCNTPVRCTSCSAPLTLHEHRSVRELLCHRCGTTRDAHTRCTTCDSWNLVALGIGIERVAEYLKKHLSDARVFVISSDTARTPKQARTVADECFATLGGILVGTEMALPYITQPVATSALVSIESLLCVPDFRIDEKLFNIIATLRENTTEHVYIETAYPENPMLAHVVAGTAKAFAEEELALRKQLGYPPYTRLILIRCIGTRAKVIADMETVVTLLEEYTLRVFRGFIPRGRDVELRALIRIPADEWPHEALIEKLKQLPPSCSIAIDVERVL